MVAEGYGAVHLCSVPLVPGDGCEAVRRPFLKTSFPPTLGNKAAGERQLSSTKCCVARRQWHMTKEDQHAVS